MQRVQNLSSVSCFAVFHAGKQIRVYHVGFSMTEEKRQFDNAKRLADNNAASGYDCQVQAFNSSAIYGRVVYSTKRGET